MYKTIFVNIMRLKGSESQKIKVVLKEIFKNETEKKYVRHELSRLPKGHFDEFIKTYDRLMKELEAEKTEFDLDNDNYFDEGWGD